MTNLDPVRFIGMIFMSYHITTDLYHNVRSSIIHSHPYAYFRIPGMQNIFVILTRYIVIKKPEGSHSSFKKVYNIYIYTFMCFFASIAHKVHVQLNILHVTIAQND